MDKNEIILMKKALKIALDTFEYVKPQIVAGVREALDARELVKVSVLKNCIDDPKEIAQVLAERTRSQIVQVIGKKIVLYSPSKDPNKKNKIELPKSRKKEN